MSVNSKMTALADEIRELSGTTITKSIDAMASDVNTANAEIAEQTDLIAQIATALEGKASGTGGTILPTLSNPATASDILASKEAIDGSGNKITGTIETKTSTNLTASGATVTVPAGYYATNATKSVATATQATPSVSINSSGLITASATQSAGYVSAGTKSGTKQLTTQAAKTVTPTTSDQTAVASGRYTTGAVTVKGDTNLVAGNIKSGVSIFGVSGTYEGTGSSGGASVETYTLTIINNGSNEIEIIVTQYHEQMGIISYQTSVMDGDTKVINNLLKGAGLVIGGSYVDISCSEGNVQKSMYLTYYTSFASSCPDNLTITIV